MSDPNNCATCDYKQMNDDPELHCYMFKDVPTEVCAKHSVAVALGEGRPVSIKDFASLNKENADRMDKFFADLESGKICLS